PAASGTGWRAAGARRASGRPTVLAPPRPPKPATVPRLRGERRLARRQSLSHPDQRRRDRALVAPWPLGIAVGAIESERGRMGIDDDLAAAEGMRRCFREPEQNRPVPPPLQVRPDADQAQTRLHVVDEVDAYGADHFAVADQHMRQMAGLELIAVVLVIGLTRQQSAQDPAPPDPVTRAPLLPPSPP